jgi:hypothetical protein
MKDKDEHKSKKTKHATRTKHQPKVFDISRPGKAPASPTSRPWVAPTEAVADDQFVPGAPSLRASDPNAKHDLMDSKKKKDLQPLTGTSESPEDTGAAAQASAPLLNNAPEIGEAEVSQSASAAPSAPVVSEAAEAQPTSAALSDTAPEVSTPTDQIPSAVAPEADTHTPVVEHEETPAHLALEQTVSNQDNLPIWEHPDTSEQVETSRPAPSSSGAGKKSIEDLLAETGAPTLEPEKEPSMIISHHPRKKSKWWHSVLIFLAIIAIAAIVFDVLIDMAIIRTTLSVPHTNFFN